MAARRSPERTGRTESTATSSRGLPRPSRSRSQARITTCAKAFGRPPSNSPNTQLANRSALRRGSSVDRSNNDRGLRSFLAASTVHNRAKAATRAVSAASLGFFPLRVKGRIGVYKLLVLLQPGALASPHN